MNPLCAKRALAIALPSRRTTESTLSSNSRRAARASRIDGSHHHDQRIGARIDGCLSAFIQLLANGHIVELRIRNHILRRIGGSFSLQHLLYFRIVLAQRRLASR